MSKRWPQTVGDGGVCMCARARTRVPGEGKDIWLGAEALPLFRDCPSEGKYFIPLWNVFNLPPPRVGEDWDSGCQGVCVGRGRDANGEVWESGKILERMGFFFHGSPSGFSTPSLFCILI